MTPIRILSIATLFPDAARPNFGLFVEKSLRALAAHQSHLVDVVKCNQTAEGVDISCVGGHCLNNESHTMQKYTVGSER